MTTTLTNEEKLTIISQHLRNIDYSLYGFELDLMEANAVTPVDTENVSLIEGKISSLNSKRTALESEAASLTE